MGKATCPDCNGKKIIFGECECNSEWRHFDDDESVDDCICNPDKDCPTCNGTGYVNE